MCIRDSHSSTRAGALTGRTPSASPASYASSVPLVSNVNRRTSLPAPGRLSNWLPTSRAAVAAGLDLVLGFSAGAGAGAVPVPPSAESTWSSHSPAEGS